MTLTRAVRTALFSLGVFSLAPLTPGTARAQETFKLGLIAPLTGPTTWAGAPERLAAQMAVDEVNAGGEAGSVKFTLDVADGACDPRTTYSAAQKLVGEDHVQALIGEFCSSASIAAAQVANDAGIPMIVEDSTADGIAKNGGQYIFQSIMQNKDIDAQEAALLQKEFKFKTAAILVENNDFGLSFRANMRKALEDAGVKISVDVAQDYTDTNWYSTLTRIQGAAPDIIVMSVSAGQAANLVKQYSEAGMKIPLFCDYTPPPYLFEKQVGVQAGKIGFVRGTFFLSSPENTPKQAAFVTKFEALAKEKLGQEHHTVHWDVVTYDAVKLYAQAIKAAGSTKPDDIAKALGSIKYDGVLGTYQFDADREIKPDGFRFLFIKDMPDGSLQVLK